MGSRFIAALAGAAALLVPASAHAADPVKKPLTFQVKVGPNNDITCSVSANLFIPDGASASHPVPAILATNGFGGSKSEFDTLGMSYAKRGYAFLAYSGLGFGGSGCKIELDDPDYDGKAGSQLVDFLGGSKAATDGTKADFVIHDAKDHDGVARPDDPRVGMIGGSYGGQIQFSVAGIDHRVDALVPQITWNDLSYSLTPNNTDFTKGVTYGTAGVPKLDWPVLFTALGLADTFAGGTPQDPSHYGTCPNFDDRVCPGLVVSATSGYPDDATLALLRHASVATYMEKIKVPTFLAQGENDTLFDLQEAAATYRALFAQHTPVKMLWRSSGHSGGDIGNAENNEGSPENGYESRMELEWFDYYLRGLGDAPKLDFTFLRNWVSYKDDAAPAVGETPSYPAGADQQLYLSSDGALAPSASAAKAGSSPFVAVPVAPTSTGGGYTDQGSTDGPGTSTAFTSGVLDHDVDVVGIPQLSVKIDAPTFAASQGAGPAGMLVLFAKLYDVDPASGDAVLPQNLVSAARIPDVGKQVRIELPGIVHHFPKGHELRLVLSTSDVTFRSGNGAGPVSVVVDPASPSVLTIPQLGAQIGAPGSGPSGVTKFKPSPEAPRPQRSGLGGPPAGTPAAAATLPSAKRCVSRRAFTIHLRRPRHARIRSVRATVNGRAVHVTRGKRLSARVNLRGVKRSTVRVVITVRTSRGRVLRSARTYHTCATHRR